MPGKIWTGTGGLRIRQERGQAEVTQRAPTCWVWMQVTSSLRTERRWLRTEQTHLRVIYCTFPLTAIKTDRSSALTKVTFSDLSCINHCCCCGFLSKTKPKMGLLLGLINLPACQSAELRGKSRSAADCRLGSGWWKHCPHVFVIRGNKKEWKEKEEEEEEGKRRRWRGRGGQMCLQVLRRASRWRCETVQRVKPHLLQIDRQAGRQLSPFQTRGTSGKIEHQLLGSCFQSWADFLCLLTGGKCLCLNTNRGFCSPEYHTLCELSFCALNSHF